MLNTKDLVFKEQLVKKLVDWYVGPYIINKVVSINVVKLQLPTSMRIYPVMNISWVVWYKEQVESERSKTSRGRRSQKVESRENTK